MSLFYLITPEFSIQLRTRYQLLRQKHASRWDAFILSVCWLLCWVLIPLENANWQWLLAQRAGFVSMRTRPGAGDPLRLLLQGFWLLCFLDKTRTRDKISIRWKSYFTKPNKVIAESTKDTLVNLVTRYKARLTLLPLTWKGKLIGVIAGAFSLLCITQPFTQQAQLFFVLLLAFIAFLLRMIPGRYPDLMLIVLSIIISCRYIWWRYTSTLDWFDSMSLFCGLLLLLAETYAWLVLLLGYWQMAWPLHRKPAPLPADCSDWPTVDLFIPTYNEDLSIVKATVYAALALDWPQSKLTIWLLDDGGRETFRQFSENTGIRYIARPTHEHAKAGNINYALKMATGDLVAIFDCDHLPTRAFLQMTVGWFFKDPSLGLVQTPHHFFSADPFERNLHRFRKMPNEGALFYGLVQNGNDTWDASFFCGSCAVIKRSALDEIGGIAVETVTEDAHTSLRLHRKGYHSAYINIPLAAGLATESLSAHIGQRIRWARGMVQILRLDNPLFGKGISLGQRLCYFNAMLHFLSGLPRLIFLTAPLAFLILHAYIIYAPAMTIALYMLPHIFHSTITNSRLQGKVRHSFWSEVYETVLAWYIAKPTTIALFAPHRGKFNVTAKGGLNTQTYLDLALSRPYLALILLNFCGVGCGIWRLFTGQVDEIPVVLLSMIWTFYNLTILGGALAVAFEAKQVRSNPRVEINMSAAIKLSNGFIYPCELTDYSNGGVGVRIMALPLTVNERIWLLLSNGQKESAFAARVRRVAGEQIGLELEGMNKEQNIAFLQCTFARADSWLLWQKKLTKDRPLHNLLDITRIGWGAYGRLIRSTKLLPIYNLFANLMCWIFSYIPRRITSIEQVQTLMTHKVER